MYDNINSIYLQLECTCVNKAENKKKRIGEKNLRSYFSKPPYKRFVLLKVISVQTHLKY